MNVALMGGLSRKIVDKAKIKSEEFNLKMM
jgi:hypothetical protein